MFKTPTHDTRTDEVRDRYRKFFDDPFMPTIRHQQMPGSDERVAYATEFAAHQLGRIDEKLGSPCGNTGAEDRSILIDGKENSHGSLLEGY
jgi:hypothetical protein